MSEQQPAHASARALLADPAFRAALAIAVVVALGFGLVVPILPAFAYSFGVSLFAASAIVSVFAAVRLASNLYTGGLADRMGTRRAIAWGALIVAASSVLAGAAPGYWWLLLFRGVGGFGGALFFNGLMTHVISIVPAWLRGRAVGMLQGAFLFGIAFGPSVGGALAAPLGFRWPLVIYGGFCAGAAAVAMLGLPRAPSEEERSAGEAERTAGSERLTGEAERTAGSERLTGDAEQPGGNGERLAGPRRPTGVRALLRTAAGFCKDPSFVAALVMMGASRWAATGVGFSLVPLYGAEAIGAGSFVVGAALTLASATHIALLWPAGKLIDTRGRRALAAPSFLVFAAASLGLVLVADVPAFLVAMAFYGAGMGLTSVTPPAVVGDIAASGDTGKAVGVLNTAGDLGNVLGPLVSGWLAEQAGFGWGFGASAALLLVAAGFGARMRETLPEPSPRTGEM